MRILEEQERARRRNSLLQAVILEYIRTASPVASSTVSKMDGMELSSATIRNFFHELEEEGFLTHPHTSAGRTPTDKGYRYYVDYLLNLQGLLEEEQKKIEQEYERRLGEIESVLSRTSRMLAYLSHHAGFVLRPKMEMSTLQRIELIACDEGHVLVVLVAKNGLVRYRLVRAPRSLPEEELRRMSRWINKRFHGKNLKDLCLGFSDEAMDDLIEESAHLRETLKIFVEPVSAMAEEQASEEILIEGTNNVLSSPELAGASTSLRRLAETLEDREEMFTLLKKEILRVEPKSKKGISVVIGHEASAPELKELSLVARTFEADNHTVGVLGILGPKRMEYGRMVSLVEAIHGALEKAIRIL